MAAGHPERCSRIVTYADRVRGGAMVRRAVIAVLVLAAVLTAGAWLQTRQPPWEGGRYWSGGWSSAHVDIYHGSIAVWHDALAGAETSPASPRPGGTTGHDYSYASSDQAAAGGFAGFNWSRRTVWPVGTHEPATRTVVVIPLWAPFLLFVAYPMAALLRGPLRRQRLRSGRRCADCGYDLTGNTSGACPECGAAVVGGRRGHHAPLSEAGT